MSAQCEIEVIPYYSLEKKSTEPNSLQQNYLASIDQIGLEETWNILLNYLRSNGISEFNKNVVNYYSIGNLYEIGLAHQNKWNKKMLGKYYTPMDASELMAELFCSDDIDSVADVGCGCGNLIIAVLDELQSHNSALLEKIRHGGIYLYDSDPVALKICSARIEVKFGISEKDIHMVCGDFFEQKDFPKNPAVISNPPYSSHTAIESNAGEDVKQAGDLYIAFFSRILDFAEHITIVTPQSFIVGQKFSLFRKKLNDFFYGDIYSFDNIPCPLFNGRKQGVFNTNNANGVRASISHLHRKNAGTESGFRLTHLIRFRSEQRHSVINRDFLNSQLCETRQDLRLPVKAFKSLEDFAFNILKDSYKLENLLSEKPTKYYLCVATSARYFISASSLKQKRSGFFELYAKDKKSFNLLYALLNSSYCYMWYRFFDGGILLPKSLLCKIPLPQKLSYDEKALEGIVKEIILKENDFKSYKKNGGAVQEVVKLPSEVRNRLNEFLFPSVDFNCVHQNFENIGD